MQHNDSGFTLLEVIIALAIVSMALGSTMALLAESKRLAFQATDEIGRIIYLRAAINSAQILEKPDYPENPARYQQRIDLGIDDILEKPDRQTQPIQLALEPYTLTDEERDYTLNSLRWKQLDAAR